MKKYSLLFIPFLLIFFSCNENNSVNSSSGNNTVRLVASISKTGTSTPTIVFSNESGGSSQTLSKSLDKSFKVGSGTNISLSASCTAERPVYDNGHTLGTAQCNINLKIYVNGNLKATGQNENKSSSSSFNLSASCSTVVP